MLFGRKSMRYNLLWDYVRIIQESQLSFIQIILLWRRLEPLVTDEKSGVDEVTLFSCLVPLTMQGKRDLGVNISALVNPVDVPAWPEVSSSCGIILGGRSSAVGLASHQMLLCVLKSAIHGLCWSTETLSLSVIPHITDAICWFISPAVLRAEPVTQCCAGTDLFQLPSRLCTSFSNSASRDVMLVAWKQLGEKGVWREKRDLHSGIQQTRTSVNAAHEDFLCLPSPQELILNIYQQTARLCPFYFVTLAAWQCTMDIVRAW